MNIITAADYANRILENNTQYLSNKLSISAIITSKEEYSIEDIVTHLILIDSCYSTNFNKRYFGFSELAEEIHKQIGSNKKYIQDQFNQYLYHENEFVESVFNKEYGYTKLVYMNNERGEKIEKKFGKAYSLLSKYAYFLTDYKFPIFDSLVIKMYPRISNSLEIRKQKLAKNDFGSFKMQMKELNEVSRIDDFNKLDNLLWLMGKIDNGNYSLILQQENYKTLIQKVFKDVSNNIENDKKKINEKIKIDVLKNFSEYDFLGNDLMKFIGFSRKFLLKNNYPSNLTTN